MLHYNLTQHSDKCVEKKEKAREKTIEANDKNNDWLFEMHIPCTIMNKMFLLKGQFVIVSMNSCMQQTHSELYFMEYLINSCAQNTLKKHKNLCYNTRRSIVLNESWKNEASRQRLFNQRHQEVNYIYFDNANKKYGICTTYDFGTYIGDRVDFCNEYKKTLKYIDENFENHESARLAKLAEELYYNNNVTQLYDTKLVMRTTEELISNIKNQIK